MTVTELYAPAASAALRWQRLMRVSRRILVLLRRRARRARRMSELSRLDERLLYDIGIDPLDLHGALNQQRSRLGLVRLAMRHRLDQS
ncbi:MAG: DUF1127 domain-containing protein [Devosia sp.]